MPKMKWTHAQDLLEDLLFVVAITIAARAAWWWFDLGSMDMSIDPEGDEHEDGFI